MKYDLVAMKRRWVPEWLFRIFTYRNLAVKQPLRWILTTSVDEFTSWRVNGHNNQGI